MIESTHPILKLLFDIFTILVYFSNVPKLVSMQEAGLLYSKKRFLNAPFYLEHFNVKNTNNWGKVQN